MISSLNNVKPSLAKIAESLNKVQDTREFLLKNTRDIIIQCSRSIIAIHKGDVKLAKENLCMAEQSLKTYQKKVVGDLGRYLVTAEQEFVEASCTIAIYEKREIPSLESLSVMPESYVLGLLDSIGELKRMTLDNIRVGNVNEAIRIFEIMESLYLELYTFSLYDKVVKEARKKIDVNRRLVEDVRSAITEETRRSELIKIFSKFK